MGVGTVFATTVARLSEGVVAGATPRRMTRHCHLILSIAIIAFGAVPDSAATIGAIA
jgi:hypothetical protein